MGRGVHPFRRSFPSRFLHSRHLLNTFRWRKTELARVVFHPKHIRVRRPYNGIDPRALHRHHAAVQWLSLGMLTLQLQTHFPSNKSVERQQLSLKYVQHERVQYDIRTYRYIIPSQLPFRLAISPPFTPCNKVSLICSHPPFPSSSYIFIYISPLYFFPFITFTFPFLLTFVYSNSVLFHLSTFSISVAWIISTLIFLVIATKGLLVIPPLSWRLANIRDGNEDKYTFSWPDMKKRNPTTREWRRNIAEIWK